MRFAAVLREPTCDVFTLTLQRCPPCASSLRIGRGDCCSGVTVPGVEDREEAREMTEAILPSLVACRARIETGLRGFQVGHAMHHAGRGGGPGKCGGSRP